MPTSSKRIFPVIGMGRSGTSMIGASLGCFDVSMGENLISGDRFNARGYFEDAVVKNIDHELLAIAGYDLDSAGVDAAKVARSPGYHELFHRAVEYVGSQYSSSASWSFKHPDASRLLPFWRQVFETLSLDDRYIICVRHPVSVVESVITMGGFHPMTTLLKWMEYTVRAIQDTLDRPTLIVGYEQMLSNPQREIERIGAALELKGELVQSKVDEYAKGFVDESLQHSSEQPSLPEAWRRQVPLLGETFALVEAAANDQLPREEFLARWRSLYERYEAVWPEVVRSNPDYQSLWRRLPYRLQQTQRRLRRDGARPTLRALASALRKRLGLVLA